MGAGMHRNVEVKEDQPVTSTKKDAARAHCEQGSPPKEERERQPRQGSAVPGRSPWQALLCLVPCVPGSFSLSPPLELAVDVCTNQAQRGPRHKTFCTVRTCMRNEAEGVLMQEHKLGWWALSPKGSASGIHTMYVLLFSAQIIFTTSPFQSLPVNLFPFHEPSITA